MAETLVFIHHRNPIGVISPRLYGQFIEHLGRCCYDGLWVGKNSDIPNNEGWRTDALVALETMGVPVLRWPGGCYADHYHWRDGIGPAENRPRRLGMSCGLTVEDDNTLGTPEFLHYAAELGADAYLAGNVGTGTPQELCDWLEYCNSAFDTDLTRMRKADGAEKPWNVPFWGVGNENWGCGGNFTPAQYALEYKRYATMLRHIDPSAQLVICGWDTEEWNRTMLETIRPHFDLVDHVSIHRYWSAGPALTFNEDDYYNMIKESDKTEPYVARTAQIIAGAVGSRHTIGIALDEWGVWSPEARHTVNYEEPSTLRDAISAAITFEGFHRQCQVMSMANIAQTANVLHACVQTEGKNMWLTPTYHTFAMYRPHQGATAMHLTVTGSHSLPDGSQGVSATASRAADGSFTVSLVNRHLENSAPVRLAGCGMQTAEGKVLTADSPAAVNSASVPEKVAPAPFEVTGSGEEGWLCTLPPHSIATIRIA